MANLIFFVEIKFCSLRVRRVPIYSSWLQHGQNMKFIFLGQMAEVGNITNIFAPCANYFQLDFDKVFNTAWAEYVTCIFESNGKTGENPCYLYYLA